MSNVSKMLHDTTMAIVRKVGSRVEWLADQQLAGEIGPNIGL